MGNPSIGNEQLAASGDSSAAQWLGKKKASHGSVADFQV
jgi:hypothetical protein